MSGLAFFNPLFLSLLPLALAPVVFHLFFRTRARPRSFPTLLFFRRLDPRLDARRRLREWLVLLLRVLLLASVLLALARPTWVGAGRESATAVAIVIDNSGSMSGAGSAGRSKLREVVGAARDLVAGLRPKDSAALVLLVDDPSVPLPAGLVSDKALLQGVLDRVSETEASGSVARALDRALALVADSASGQAEIHLFTDLQEGKWSVAAGEFRAPREGTVILVHRVPSPGADQPNVSLAGAHLTDKVILAGRRLALPVVLSNPSGAEGRVRLNCADDAGHPQVQEVAVPARGEKTVLVPLAPANAGYRWVNLWLEGDEFPADNRAALGFYCTERRSVLLAGQRPQFGLLPVALSPGGDGRLSGLIVQSTDAAGLREKLQEPARTFPVLTWESWKQLLGGSAGGRWRQFLESGGQALLVPAAGSDGGGLPAESGLNPAALPAERDEKGRGLVVVNPAHPLFGDLRDARGGLAWPNVRVFRWHPLAGGAASLPILGVENGPVVLAAQSVGRGTLYVSGVAFDPAWTTLPLKPAFLALAQAMAMAGAGSARNQENLTAGEPLKEGRRFQGDLRIQSLAGGPLDWKGPAADFPNFTRAGVYRVQAGSESVQVAVRSSDREGRQRFLAGDTVPALGKLDYRVTSSPAGAAGAAAAARLGKRVHLRLPLLLGAASLFLLEGWLANPAPVARRRRGAPGPGAATPSPA